MLENKVVIYTAILGGYDDLVSPKVINKNTEYVCFSDKKIECPPWKVIKFEPILKNPRRESRRYKMMPHKFLDCGYSVYIDGNLTIMSDFIPYIKVWLGVNDIAVLKHPQRNCLYEEGKACIKQRKDSKEIILKQIKKYKKVGYPENAGLAACGFIIRKHTPQIAKFNETWWNEYNNYSQRDQMSFNYIMWRLKINYSIIPIVFPWYKQAKFIKHRRHKR